MKYFPKAEKSLKKSSPPFHFNLLTYLIPSSRLQGKVQTITWYLSHGNSTPPPLAELLPWRDPNIRAMAKQEYHYTYKPSSHSHLPHDSLIKPYRSYHREPISGAQAHRNVSIKRHILFKGKHPFIYMEQKCQNHGSIIKKVKKNQKQKNFSMLLINALEKLFTN